MLTPTRVFISVPSSGWLQPEQLDIKNGVIDRVRLAGFEPQEFLTSGDFTKLAWSHDNLQHRLGRCQGAVILGLVRWEGWDINRKQYKFNTAYNHYEGALALAKNIPTFILMHEHVYKAGIALKSRKQHFVKLPDKANSSWLQTDQFLSKFNEWADVVKKRYLVFLGYSSNAGTTAAKIKDYLTSRGVSVMDWAVDFKPAFPVIDKIERASKSCMGSIFLFTKDDDVTTGEIEAAATRDTVIFEAGYFVQAKGIDKTLIIKEEGVNLPAKLGGSTFRNRDDLSSIEKDLEKFIVNNL